MIAKHPVQKTEGRAQIARIREKGLHATIVQRARLREFHVTLAPVPGDTPETLVQRLRAIVSANSASIVREEAFGSHQALKDLNRIQSRCFGRVNWPMSCVEAHACEQAPLAGLHAFAISGVAIDSLAVGEHTVGTVFSDGFTRHCLLGDVTPGRSPRGCKGKTLEVFQELATHLRSAEMELTDVARTWLFLDDILSWYGPFNKERREIFEAFGIFDHCVPASTGIGAANPRQGVLIAGAWAVQSLDHSAAFHAVESPLQCSARDYGSCFSRAVEICAPDLRRLLISGTASIAPDGATQFRGDIRKQVARTMEVVEAILASRGMGWQDANRATIYLRNAADAWAYCEYVDEQDLVLPALVTEATVCRDDLLFEIEVDAMSNRGSRGWQV